MSKNTKVVITIVLTTLFDALIMIIIPVILIYKLNGDQMLILCFSLDLIPFPVSVLLCCWIIKKIYNS